MSEFSSLTTPMKDASDLHTRCSLLVEQANLLSEPTHDIWSGLPSDLALQLAIQLSGIHSGALSIQAWFDEDQGDNSYHLLQLNSYLDEVDRFFTMLKKAG